MFAFIAVLLLGYAGAKDNFSQVTDWVVATDISIEQAGATPDIRYPNGEYLKAGVKPIAWAVPEERPDGKVFAPVDSNGSRWVAVKKVVPIVKTNAAPVPPPVAAEVTDATLLSPNAGVLTDDQDNPDKKKVNTGVDTDKILSYFEKEGYRRSSHEELGNFAIPNQPAPPLPTEQRPEPDLH